MEEFICACCGDDTEVRFLSRGSLDKAGTDTRRQAVLVLSEVDLVCQFCEDDQPWDEDELTGSLGNYVLDGVYLSDITPLERFQSLV